MSQLIKPGTQGEQVTALQTKLAALGFTLKVDGHFGPGTRAAVEDLQSVFGYDVDGVVGDGTGKLIEQQAGVGFNLSAPDALKRGLQAQGSTPAPLKRTLKKGVDGADVRYLQLRLTALGYSVSVDGKFGDGTEKAVRALQQQFGYDVDGIVGEATHKLLNQQIGYDFKAPVA
ncbi:MAG: peptidoglycan-binding protein [Polyangiales bacterium]